MKTKKIMIPLFLGLLLLSACAGPSKSEHQIESFSFTNQEGIPFGMDDLNDSIWIADFIFTNCTTVCQPMTSKMAAIQQTLKEQNLPVEFISFTVDPVVDSPEVLKSYILEFTDDLSNWNLLTGYSQKDIEIFGREQFKTIVQKPDATSQVIHSSSFFLVDKKGHLIGEYNYMDTNYLEDMLEDIKYLSK